ncbi:MAG: hypothetical protein IJ874_03600 [Ruminococcus sp.]|nr:hypothetical protein [Ruminococcus sp.]
MKDISYRVALGGIVSALCLVTMFLAGILPALYLLLPMIAGVLLMVIASEVSTQWAALTYTAVSLLSLIITADKEAALVFIMLFGHYPILRFYIQRISIKWLRFTVKLIVFNVCAIAYFFVTVYLFGLVGMLEEINDIGQYGSIIMLLVCDLIFLMYDFNLSAIYSTYIKRLRPKFRKK